MGIAISLRAEPETTKVVKYIQYANGEWHKRSIALPNEMMLSVFVNRKELVTILCTPEKLNSLVIGFLRSEGFISCLDDIALMRVCPEGSMVDVRLTHQLSDIPSRRILTSGCGSGISFETGTNVQPISSCRVFSPTQISSSIRSIQRQPESQRENGGMRRGVHISALSDGNEILVQADDIGRHNTLDKILGECMLKRIATEDLLLVTTGRISSEMLSKVAKMGVPVVVSLNSATNRAVQRGAELGIAIVGYAHGNQFSVYCCEKRLLPTGD